MTATILNRMCLEQIPCFLETGALGTAIFSDSNIWSPERKDVLPADGRAVSRGRFDPCRGTEKHLLPQAGNCPPGDFYKAGKLQRRAFGILTDLPSGLFDTGKDPLSVPVLPLQDPEEIARRILDFYFAVNSLSMVILAGGLSNRMGEEKADLNIMKPHF